MVSGRHSLIPFIALLVLNCRQETSRGRIEAQRDTTYVIQIGATSLSLQKSRWTPMQNEVDWAVNFEDTTRTADHVYGRVITIYKLPMSTDRQVGTRISPNEWLELFVVQPGTFTIQVRADRGKYWVLSRETVRPSPPIAGVSDPGSYLTGAAFRRTHLALQRFVDDTRHLIHETFPE